MVATNRHRKADEFVPLSADIIAIAQALQAYQAWLRLAVQIDPQLEVHSWYDSSADDFNRRLGEAARAAGLNLNRATFDSLSTVNWPREVLDTPVGLCPSDTATTPAWGCSAWRTAKPCAACRRAWRWPRWNRRCAIAREGLRLAGRPAPAPGEASEVVAERLTLGMG
jgi:hypothetical protein